MNSEHVLAYPCNDRWDGGTDPIHIRESAGRALAGGAMDIEKLKTLAALIDERNEVSSRVTALTVPPAQIGQLGDLRGQRGA